MAETKVYADKYAYQYYDSDGYKSYNTVDRYGPPNSPIEIQKMKWDFSYNGYLPIYTITFLYTYTNAEISQCEIKKKYSANDVAGARKNTYVKYTIDYTGKSFDSVTKETGTVS